MIEQELEQLVEEAIREFLSVDLPSKGPRPDLTGLGFVTTDQGEALGCYFRYRDDFPANAPDEVLLSAVEWPHSSERAFSKANAYLKKLVSTGEDGLPVRLVAAVSQALETEEVRKLLPADVYLTFAGADPGSELLEIERTFVSEKNSPDVLARWDAEFYD